MKAGNFTFEELDDKQKQRAKHNFIGAGYCDDYLYLIGNDGNILSRRKMNSFDFKSPCVDCEGDLIWWYCKVCDEEYLLPEFCPRCPICGKSELEEI